MVGRTLVGATAVVVVCSVAATDAHITRIEITTFSLMKPIDMTRSSGVLMYSVVNRRNGAAAASAEGHVSLVSGWQGDVVPTATNQTIQVPAAKNPDGSSITGPLVLRFTGLKGTTTTLTIPRNQPSPYPPVTLDTSRASLVGRVRERDRRQDRNRRDPVARLGSRWMPTATRSPA